MTDEEIYKEIKFYFSAKEFVGRRVYKKYGERSWKFICPRLLHTILVIRIAADAAMTINNWASGGKFSQRGLRSNLSQIFYRMFQRKKLYLSGHVLGRAVDFDIKGMTAPEVRQWLKGMHKELPYKIRLENKMNGKQINWVHLDMIWEEKNPKVYLFNI